MRKKLSFEQEWTREVPDRPNILRYMREAIGVNEVQWDDINARNMDKVKKLMKANLSGNSPQTYFAIIKSFCKKYGDFIDDDDATDNMRAKRMPSENVFLTEEEIGRIERYADALDKKVGHQAEKDALNAFIVESYCGARGIDVKNFTEENIVDGYLVYVSQKTKVLSKVPIHPKIADRITRKSAKNYDASSMNRIIKRVAEKVGITQPVTIFYRGKLRTLPKYKFVAFHSARRSFCSNLANRGVDIYTIASLANHSKNINMTMRYIISDTNHLSQEALDFFNG
jgi:integrase